MIREGRRAFADHASRELVASTIVFYQRRLSPLKGFSCAHRVLHGGPSCSQHVKTLVLDLGPLAARAPARARLGKCREANEALRAGASPARATGQRRRRKKPWYRRWGRRGRDAAEDLFEDDSGSEGGFDAGGEGGSCEASDCVPDSLECGSCDINL